MLSVRSSLSVALLLLAGCHPAKKSEINADEKAKPKTVLNLHDVAILFPLLDWKEKDKSEHLKIALNSKLEGSQGFVPAETNKNILVSRDESLYRLAAIRIDPCVNQPTAKGNKDICIRQLRLVWQQYFRNSSQTDGKAIDNNIHTIYSLSKEDFAGLVSQMRKLHDAAGFDYSKEALGPHSVLLKEGTSGQYYQGLKKVLAQYARVSNLAQIARFMITLEPPFMTAPEWNFKIFSFSKGQFVEQGKFAQTLQSTIPPFNAAQHADSLAREFSDEQNWKNSFVVENPNLHDPLSMDCGSCHSSTKARFLLEVKKSTFPIPAERYVNSKWNMTVNMEKQMPGGVLIPSNELQTPFQNFSILHDKYRISQRVVNESALSADTINDQY